MLVTHLLTSVCKSICIAWIRCLCGKISMRPKMLQPQFCDGFLQALVQVQVMARTICMQFEGNWTPVTDIVVDKVGKYAYVIGSPHDAAATPVVMDVVLDVRTKVPLSSACCSSCIHFACWVSYRHAATGCCASGHSQHAVRSICTDPYLCVKLILASKS